MKINVYDENDNVIKTAEAKMVDIKFGTIRSLMELLNIDSVGDDYSILETVYSAWDQIVVLLEKVFPDMEYADWENVKVKELVPILMELLRYTFGEIMKVPKDSKN